MGYVICCCLGQCGGCLVLNICSGLVLVIFMYGVDCWQQFGLCWMVVFNSECFVQMGMGFYQVGECQGFCQVLQVGSWLVGWGQCGDLVVVKGQVCQQWFIVGLCWLVVGQCSGWELGVVDIGEWCVRGGECYCQFFYRFKIRFGDFVCEQQSVIWLLLVFFFVVSMLFWCLGILLRILVIQELYIFCLQESIIFILVCCNI